MEIMPTGVFQKRDFENVWIWFRFTLIRNQIKQIIANLGIKIMHQGSEILKWQQHVEIPELCCDYLLESCSSFKAINIRIDPWIMLEDRNMIV